MDLITINMPCQDIYVCKGKGCFLVEGLCLYQFSMESYLFTIPGIILQDACPLRLWVAVLDPPEDATLTLDNLPVLLYEVVDKLNDAGMGSRAELFLAAHGQAGWCEIRIKGPKIKETENQLNLCMCHTCKSYN